MGALFFGMAGLATLGEICLYVGLVLVLGSTAQYVREAVSHDSGPAEAQAQLDIAKVPNITTGEDTRRWTPSPTWSLSDQELKDLIQQLTDEEQEVSYRRRILHGKIDILRAELVNRLRKKHEGGEEVISGADVQRLTDILAGRASGDGDELSVHKARRASGPPLPRVRLRRLRRGELLPQVRRFPGHARADA